MKALHVIFTALAIIFLLTGLPSLIAHFDLMAQVDELHFKMGILIGSVLGYLFLPALFLLARHYVAKKIAL